MTNHLLVCAETLGQSRGEVLQIYSFALLTFTTLNIECYKTQAKGSNMHWKSENIKG